MQSLGTRLASLVQTEKDEREYAYSDGIINSKEIKINTQVIMIVVN